MVNLDEFIVCIQSITDSETKDGSAVKQQQRQRQTRQIELSITLYISRCD